MDSKTEARWQRVIIEENPAFARFMSVRFTSGSRDRIEAELIVGEEFANRNGVMHGGAIATPAQDPHPEACPTRATRLPMWPKA